MPSSPSIGPKTFIIDKPSQHILTPFLFLHPYYYYYYYYYYHHQGANLCEMSRIGVPVPPGFVITTQTCLDFFSEGKQLPKGVEQEYLIALSKVRSSSSSSSSGSIPPLTPDMLPF